MNRSLKRRFTRTPGQQGIELENHFILRLPQKQADNLRDVLRSNQSSNIKDRLSIQLDYTQDKDDMRNGIITVDTIMYKARLVDFPSIVESWKTIDGKNFYKTADICQMLMVRDGEEPAEEEDSKKRRRDHPNRVDKKYLWPHGYTPPLKNVRKRRFRKMLRKKILELPEIEKEVKRLLRADEEALSVKWEVLKEDEEKGAGASGNAALTSGAGPGASGENIVDGMNLNRHDLPTNLDEQLFGEMVSSSDDEVGPINILDEDEDSRLSVEDSRFSESYMHDTATGSPHMGISSRGGGPPMPHLPHHQQYRGSPSPPLHQGDSGLHQDASGSSSYYTEFNSSMFRSSSAAATDNNGNIDSIGGPSTAAGGNYSNNSNSMFGGDDSFDAGMEGGSDGNNPLHADDNSNSFGDLDTRDRGGLEAQVAILDAELMELASERIAHQSHMDSLDNAALKSRFLSKLQDIHTSMIEKQAQIRRINAALNN